MPQRGELAQAQRLPRATLLAQRTGPGEDDMSCTVGQHSLKVLLYPTPCTAPFGTCKLFLLWWGGVQNELAYAGETQLKNSD